MSSTSPSSPTAHPALKFGAGASEEIGFDLTTYDARRVLVITDPGVAATGHPERIAEQIRASGASRPRSSTGCTSSRPTPASSEAIAFARDERTLGRVRRGRRRVGDRHREGGQPAHHATPVS